MSKESTRATGYWNSTAIQVAGAAADALATRMAIWGRAGGQCLACDDRLRRLQAKEHAAHAYGAVGMM
jgi:hypothetical protein